MKRKTRQTPDPIERDIERALQPGDPIYLRDSGDFIADLEAVAARINPLRKQDPARAAHLYEIFLAGCREKGEEIHFSGDEFHLFVRGLIAGWIKARQAARMDPMGTAETLLAWAGDDDWAFFSNTEMLIAQALDRNGREAYAAAVLRRLEQLPRGEEWQRRCCHDILRAIHLAQHDVAAYVELAERTGLTPNDCLALARLEVARRPAEALRWVERGLRESKTHPLGHQADYDLGRMEIELLMKLGRRGDAVERVWADYREHPSLDGFRELMKLVPQAGRTEWREKALVAAEAGDLFATLELFVAEKERQLLADLVSRINDAALAGVSHYATEPAAKMLEKSHPAPAAKLWRAQAMRIVEAKKSKYYEIAAANLARARACYLRAGLPAEWDALVAQVREKHFRKAGFMAAFEAVAPGGERRREPSFLERAKLRWGVVRGGGEE